MTMDRVRELAKNVVSGGSAFAESMLIPPVELRHAPTKALVKASMIGKSNRKHAGKVYCESSWIPVEDLEEVSH